MKTVCVLGDGAWGTAIAQLLAENGHTVNLWCYDESVCKSISNSQINTKYLPDILLSDAIKPTISLQKAIENSEWIFEAVPVKYLRSIINQLQPHIKNSHKWIVLSKGIEQDSWLLPSQIIDDVFGKQIQSVIVSGPSFASELVRKQKTAVMAASADASLLNNVTELLSNDYFKIYYSSDLIGVQLSAALKNVIAIMMGILNGAGYGNNTRAWLFTLSLQEIALLTQYYGGKMETVYGLAGIGDLVLTAFSHTSKNFNIGFELGKGHKLSELLKKYEIPEGINTIASVKQLIDKSDLNLPICSALHQYIFHNAPIESLINQ